MNIGLIYARGRGSTLVDKNIYPLNNTPMIVHFMQEISKCRELDHICVWTESEKIAELAVKHGGTALHRPHDMVHRTAGIFTIDEWSAYVNWQVEELFGPPDVIAHLNCNYVLLKAETISNMFLYLKKNPEINSVFPVAPVSPEIVFSNPETGYIMPLFPDMEHMVRKIGIELKRSTGTHSMPYLISWEEGRDVQHEDDIAFAEYVLSKRQRCIRGD